MKKFSTLMLCTIAFSSTAALDEIVKDCDSCHGDGGVSAESTIPSIAGLPAYNIEEAFFAYKEDIRPSFKLNDVDMTQVANKLNDDQISEIAEYYSSKPFRPANQNFINKLAKAGAKIHKAKCEKCHSEGGTVADDEASILKGQQVAYLSEQMDLFVSGKREGDDGMITALKTLKPKYKEALLSYYASQE